MCTQRTESNPSGAYALRLFCDFQSLHHHSVSGRASLSFGERPLTSCPAKAPHLDVPVPRGTAYPQVSPSFRNHAERLCPAAFISDIIRLLQPVTPVIPGFPQFKTDSVQLRSSSSAVRRDPPRPEVIPQRGASISAAGSSAPLERDRACRDLSLGLCPSSALLAKRFAARLLEYPPSGVRLIRPASVTCGHLHRDPMDLIRFSRFAGLSPPPLRIESNPSGAFALRCQALLHNSVSGQTGWAREATPCHLPGQGATP